MKGRERGSGGWGSDGHPYLAGVRRGEMTGSARTQELDQHPTEGPAVGRGQSLRLVRSGRFGRRHLQWLHPTDATEPVADTA